MLATMLLSFTFGAAHAAPTQPMKSNQELDSAARPALKGVPLLDELQHRAFRFFWEKADLNTGLVNDRAKNSGTDDYTVASIASTGYALASLPIAVERKWVSRQDAYNRALLTLRYVNTRLPNTHGWYFHFIDKHTGARVWNCELSSIDTALLLMGTLTAGQYWPNTEVQRTANAIYDRVDWQWMLTNGGAQPKKLTLAMGWKPESGFLTNNWDRYDELMYLYLLGLGAKKPLPNASWEAWSRPVIQYAGLDTLVGGPIFMHEMPQGYYNFHNQRDRGGWDYNVSSTHAVLINHQFCQDRANKRKTYAAGFWGLNAGDYPDGYTAFGAPEGPNDPKEDGTVSPTGAIASILFAPDLAQSQADLLYAKEGDKIWGRYGFSNTFNLDRKWYDPDVIGIDLGMMILNVENFRTGQIWKLIASHPATPAAWQRAGLHATAESEPRPLRK